VNDLPPRRVQDAWLGTRPHLMDRRAFVRQSLGLSAAMLSPALIRAQGARPAMPSGVAAGDVRGTRAIVWSRTDRPARMVVEYATTEAFRNSRRVVGPSALETSAYTARVALTDLPPGQRVFYRVQFQDLTDLRAWSEPLVGAFTTASTGTARDVTIAWSADTVGQGWGINRDWGGLKLYDTMRRAQPDLFIHCGDTIYADAPLPAEVKLDDGSLWRNVVTEAKSKAAETLDEFRGNHQYSQLDEHMRRFNAEVAQMAIWDDHEVRDNWYETRDLSRDERYRTKSAALLAARARRAFLEHHPIAIDPDNPDRIHRTLSLGPTVEVFALDMRSFRGANSENRQAVLDDSSTILGSSQLAWLKAGLTSSRATWKVIASDLPIGVIVRDLPSYYEAIANGDGGTALGRELEIADLLHHIKTQGIRNVVWITGDIHYCAAHHYDPARARFTDFEPFWEFVAGPLHAGTFGPNDLDPTFGPEARFIGIPAGMKPNRPPSEGLQFFGTLRVDAKTRALTASLHDLAGTSLYRVELEARGR
jgi:alkaline phosphatase D